MNLNYYNYNNYYNRIEKKFDTLEEYEPYRIGITKFREAFNTNDGVDTQIVENWEYEIPNYCIASEGNQIISRWFLIDAVRTRKDQYKITLHRDLVADNFEEVINAPCYIEKATVGTNDPALFNSEDMTFNQIKTKETLLKDKTGVPWVVGYYARTTGGEGPEDARTTTNLKGSVTKDFPYDLIATNAKDWEYGKYILKGDGTTPIPFLGRDYIDKGEFDVQYTAKINNKYEQARYLNITNSSVVSYVANEKVGGLRARQEQVEGHMAEIKDWLVTKGRFITAYYKATSDYVNNNIGPLLDKFLALNGKVIKFSDANEYYRIKVSTPNRITRKINMTSGDSYNYLSTLFVNIPLSNWFDGTANEKTFQFTYVVDGYVLTLDKITTSELSYDITSLRYHLIDAPYDMFVMPYGDNVKIYNNGQLLTTMTKDTTFSIANAIGEKYSGSKFLYDIQLLPYCPLTTIVKNDGTIDVGGDSLVYSAIKQNGNTVGVIFNPSYCSFTVDLPLKEPIVINEPKIQAQCDMYRLVSPNYNGQFEFNAAKNNGVNRFNVDCTYLPFNPYIHVNPDFKGLYGQDFNDARGLICGGDYSLPLITNNWETYQLNNKNYLNAFNREIENMNINNKYQKTMEKWKVAVGAVQGGVSGAVMGGMVSANPIAVGAGAILGGAASLGGGIADMKLNEGLRQEALDYKQDMFEMNNQNIQALPNSIARTSAFTANNKIFPILEFYTCTDIEKQALRNKIKYNGMTVNRIGTIRDFLQVDKTYIKGKLIRMENILEDFHCLNELANEVNKGFFIAEGGKE